MKYFIVNFGLTVAVIAMAQVGYAQAARETTAPSQTSSAGDQYEYKETRDLVQFVKAAADLIHRKGEDAFKELRTEGGPWRQGEKYIFVLDPRGDMLVHPDATMEGKNQTSLKDINGKPIIRGLIQAATSVPGKSEGWFHYEWPVPGELVARWKSAYVEAVTGPSGGRYIVGSGMYNDRMERSFVVDTVKNAAAEIERNGKAAFPLFHDPKSPFLAKDAYIFVINKDGVELVNPAFPNLEGRNILDVKDTQGKKLTREMLETAQTKGSGWVDYMWPKPGESVSTEKSAYITKAKMGDEWVVVGCGVYLANAPKVASKTRKMTAPELMTLVRAGAGLLEQQGEKAFSEFRKKGSKWFHDDIYFVVWTMDGIRTFHAADPASEGADVSGLKDVLGRPIGKMFMEAATGPSGEGWAHYMYPEPGNIFPTWKSTFIKRVTFPSGKENIVACGIYNMDMDESFISDVVNRAAALVANKGTNAFKELRDKTGPFVFMDTYVFVYDDKGNEFVNPAQPSLEGKNLMKLPDVNGKLVVRDSIAAAQKNGSAWVDYYWYKPGLNTPARKHTFVRKVSSGDVTYIVGSGYYPGDEIAGGAAAAGAERK